LEGPSFSLVGIISTATKIHSAAVEDTTALIITMLSRIALLLVVLTATGRFAAAYSIYDAQKWTQKSVVAHTMSSVQRETIRMPSQKPMVPYKVSKSERELISM
jgi:small-conductance mechanosensitive channel